MLSSQETLRCDNDNSTHALRNQKDNNDPSYADDAVHAKFSKHGLALTKDGLVHWKEGGKQHPRNWKIHRKLYDSFLVILFEFLA